MKGVPEPGRMATFYGCGAGTGAARLNCWPVREMGPAGGYGEPVGADEELILLSRLAQGVLNAI